MNKFSAYRITNASLLKNYIFGTFIHHKAVTRKNILVIVLGLAMLLPRRRPVAHKLLTVHLTPVHLCTGKGPTGTFDADGALDDFEPWTGPPPAAAPARNSSQAEPLQATAEL